MRHPFTWDGEAPKREGAAAAAVRSVDEGLRFVITLGEGAALDPARLTAWIALDTAHRRLTPQMKLMVRTLLADPA